MSDAEGQEVQEITTDALVETGVSGLSHEQALAELARVRREAAARRVSEKQIKADLEERQARRDAEKTELERIAERAAKAEGELTKLQKERAARAAAKEAGLNPDLADLLKGETEEELLVSAKALAERMPAPKASTPDLFPGTRGAAVGSTPKSTAEAFRELFTKEQ